MLPSEKCQYSIGRRAAILLQDLPHHKQQSCNIPKETKQSKEILPPQEASTLLQLLVKYLL